MKRHFTTPCLFFCLLIAANNLFSTELPRYYQPQLFSYVSSIIPNADNGFTILGYFKNTATDFYRPRIIKFDQKGDVQWEKTFDNLPLLDFSAVDEGVFIKTPDNGYLL